MGVEYELKYAANEEILTRIGADYPKGIALRMESTYYDTPDGRLSKKRYTLRKRLENDQSICTVKTPLAGHGRGEWEVQDTEITAAIPRLCALGAPENLQTLTRDGVKPICGARFTRQAVTIEEESFAAELAMDRGILTGGSREQPLCEVELEYKSGSMDAFLTFAEHFAATYRLLPEPFSKFRRALNLYLGEF